MSVKCKCCGKAASKYVMNNKLVCLHCDELLIDLEIELEEEKSASQTGARRGSGVALSPAAPKKLVPR